MASTSTSSLAALTVSGTTTDFLPLATAWPSSAGCDTNIYSQMGGGAMLAWDPWFGHYLETTASTCLPPAVTSWWNQASDSTVYTALGPTFVCPAAYSTGQVALVSSDLRLVYCCPSQYSFYVPQPTTAGAFPSQCISTLTQGETLAYVALSANTVAKGWSTYTVSASSTLTVFGIPVNGFNYVPSTTASSSGASTGASSSGTATRTTISSSSSSTGATSSNASGTSSLGVTVGVSVGVVCGVLILAFAAFLFWWRRRLARSDARGADGASNTPRDAQVTASFVDPKYVYTGVPQDAAIYPHPGELGTHMAPSELGHNNVAELGPSERYEMGH